VKKTFLTGIAALLLANGTAHAEEEWKGQLLGAWSCPALSGEDADIELHKYAVHDNGIEIRGRIQVNPIRVEVKELPNGTVTLNGKRCQKMK